jgi:hypothetical protein
MYPSRRQNPLTRDHAIVQVELTESPPIAGGGIDEGLCVRGTGTEATRPRELHAIRLQQQCLRHRIETGLGLQQIDTAGLAQQLIDRHRTGQRRGRINSDSALSDQDCDECIGDRLAHRPARIRRLDATAGGVALADDLSAMHHHDG